MKEVYYFSASLSPLNDYWILKELLKGDVKVRVVDIYDLINDRDKDTQVDNAQVEIDFICNDIDDLKKVINVINENDIAFVPTSDGIADYIRRRLAVKGVKIVCDTTFSLPIVDLESDSFFEASPRYNRLFDRVLWVLKHKGLSGFFGHCIDYFNAKSPIIFRTPVVMKKNVGATGELLASGTQLNESIYLITSGAKNHLSYKLVRNASNQIKIGHYCTVFREEGLLRVIDEDYFVFIDQALPVHRDASRLGIDYSEYAEDYYKSLQLFFEKIEKTTGKKVVVALHPRTNKEYFKNFGTFECVKNKTEELIEYSSAVLTHYSTCIYSAVYRNKPIVIFTNDLMNHHHDIRRVYDFSERLNCKVIDSDNFDGSNFNEYLKLDKNKYEFFCEEYIKQCDSKSGKAIDILKDKFKL